MRDLLTIQFSLNIFIQFDVYLVRGVSLIKFTYFDSCLVFFDFDILSLKGRKIFFFVLVFHFKFTAYL